MQCVCIICIPHVRVGVWSDFFGSQPCLVSKERKHRKRYFKFPRCFSYDLFLVSVSTMKTHLLNSTAYSRTKQIYVALCFMSLSGSRLSWTVWQKCFSVIVRATVVLLVYGSYSGRFIGRAVWATSTQELRTECKSLCTTCQGCLKFGGHFSYEL
jgi:hypothetical protein